MNLFSVFFVRSFNVRPCHLYLFAFAIRCFYLWREGGLLVGLACTTHTNNYSVHLLQHYTLHTQSMRPVHIYLFGFLFLLLLRFICSSFGDLILVRFFFFFF